MRDLKFFFTHISVSFLRTFSKYKNICALFIIFIKTIFYADHPTSKAIAKTCSKAAIKHYNMWKTQMFNFKMTYSKSPNEINNKTIENGIVITTLLDINLWRTLYGGVADQHLQATSRKYKAYLVLHNVMPLVVVLNETAE